MQVAYNILLVVAVVVALVFTVLVFVTGKGDAMSGGGAVRTTFKGKASFDDQVAKLTIGLAAVFVILMLVLDLLASRLEKLG
jgi:preprotein translocase subunit SecG